MSKFLLGGFIAAIAVSLQGCDMNIPRHVLGNWRAKDNYLHQFQYTPPGAPASYARLNSCGANNAPGALVCNGHGKCSAWYPAQAQVVAAQEGATNQTAQAPSPQRRLSFCECDVEWADPECRTQRKSQRTALTLSVFLGYLGADQFYLGFPWYGLCKLITLGGCGLWYAYDVVRIGSTPVLTGNSFRVADNVSHGAFVLVMIAVTCFIGFLVSFISIHDVRVRKAREIMLLKMEANSAGYAGARLASQEPIFAAAQQPAGGLPSGGMYTGYGTTLAQGYP